MEKEKTKIKVKIHPRGRSFEGKIIKKFHDRVVVELERFLYQSKYERYEKRKTRLHAKIDEEQDKNLKEGDRVKIKECRSLSKIISFVVTDKLNGGKE